MVIVMEVEVTVKLDLPVTLKEAEKCYPNCDWALDAFTRDYICDEGGLHNFIDKRAHVEYALRIYT